MCRASAKRHAVGHDGGNQADPHQAPVRQTKQAIDEGVVEPEVQCDADQTDHHHWRGPAQRAGEAAQRHEAQKARQCQRQGNQELAGHVHVGFVLTEVEQDRLQVPQDHCGHQRHAPRQPQPSLGQTGCAGVIVGTLANCDQRTDGGHHPDAEKRHEVVAGSAQSAARQGLRPKLAHHHGVGENHQHMRHLRCDQRPGQAQDDPQFFEGVLLHGLALGRGGIDERLIVVIQRLMHKGINTIIGMSKTHPDIFPVECAKPSMPLEESPDVS
jgi:hypothetical protein